MNLTRSPQDTVEKLGKWSRAAKIPGARATDPIAYPAAANSLIAAARFRISSRCAAVSSVTIAIAAVPSAGTALRDCAVPADTILAETAKTVTRQDGYYGHRIQTIFRTLPRARPLWDLDGILSPWKP